jgi:hypothetical protein
LDTDAVRYFERSADGKIPALFYRFTADLFEVMVEIGPLTRKIRIVSLYADDRGSESFRGRIKTPLYLYLVGRSVEISFENLLEPTGFGFHCRLYIFQTRLFRTLVKFRFASDICAPGIKDPGNDDEQNDDEPE